MCERRRAAAGRARRRRPHLRLHRDWVAFVATLSRCAREKLRAEREEERGGTHQGLWAGRFVCDARTARRAVKRRDRPDRGAQEPKRNPRLRSAFSVPSLQVRVLLVLPPK